MGRKREGRREGGTEGGREGENTCFFYLFVLFRTWKKKKKKKNKAWLIAAHIPEQGSSFLSPSIQMPISPANTFTDVLEIMFCQLTGHPLAQSS